MSQTFLLESNRSLLGLARDHLNVLTDAAMGLGLCAVLFAAALGFDLVAVRASRNSGVITTTLAKDLRGTHPLTLRRDAHLAPGLIGLVLLSGLLANLGSIDIADPGQDQLLGPIVALLLQQIWIQLAIAFAVIGVVNWLTTLRQSAPASPGTEVTAARVARVQASEAGVPGACQLEPGSYVASTNRRASACRLSPCWPSRKPLQ